jgi:predicted nucleic acid binding AN1-type Zn finger protein
MFAKNTGSEQHMKLHLEKVKNEQNCTKIAIQYEKSKKE